MKKFAVFVMFFVSMFLFANLTIITEPSAMVYWNGALIDVVPLDGVLELENLDYPGTLKIVKPGYAPYETLVSTDTILKVKLSLPSYIEVTSDPENVDVIVNGNFLGTSPDVFEVSSGELLLTFEKEGYISKKFKITLFPSQIKKIHVTLTKNVKLKLISNDVIEATIDGKYIKLPTTVEVLPGKHVLKLYGKDYIKTVQEIEVPAVEEYEYNVDETVYVNLYVYGYPENANVILNNISKTSPAIFKVIPGIYDIKIESDGFKTLKEKINVTTSSNTFMYNLSKNLISSVNNSLTVFFDGYISEDNLVPKRLYFTKVVGDNKEWFGFTDGSIEEIPKSFSVIFTKDGYIEYKGVRYNSPVILNVNYDDTVKVVSNGKEESVIVKENKILDDPKSCAVNIYSKQVFDVKINGKFIGRTPIYLLSLPEGGYRMEFLKNGITIYEKNVEIKQGILNEIYGGD